MGKKRPQQHLQQSMGQMVSKAALAQMGPAIEQYVQAVVRNLGQQLSVQQASTLETIFARVVVLEEIVIEKLGYTKETLAIKVAETEDQKEGLTLVEGALEKGDVVRLEISTKAKDQPEYQGSSRLKVYQTGTGQTLGDELESALLGLKAGDTKEIEFGKDKGMLAKVIIDRVSRGPKAPEAPAPAAEATPEQAPTEGQNADQTQGQ